MPGGVPISTQQIITSATTAGMINAIALTSTQRYAPAGVNVTRYRYPKIAVSAQAETVRRRDRNPAWNILTVPEKKPSGDT